MYLQTERIFLRPIDRTDAQNLHNLNSNPEVMKYLSPCHTTIEGAREALVRIVAKNERYKNQLGLFAAIEKKSSEFIGWFILRPDSEDPDNTQNLEIGYRLKQEFWGQGFATEVSKALVEKAISDFKVKRIYAMAIKLNTASIRIMEKVGLTFESEFISETYLAADKTAVLYSQKY